MSQCWLLAVPRTLPGEAALAVVSTGGSGPSDLGFCCGLMLCDVHILMSIQGCMVSLNMHNFRRLYVFAYFIQYLLCIFLGSSEAGWRLCFEQVLWPLSSMEAYCC